MMKREIKFRGRDVITGNWAYGFYYPSNGHSIIRDDKNRECIVLEKTVSQYTGLKDKNGKDIYEGDIINIDVSGEYLTYGMIVSEVKYYTNQAQFGFTTPNGWLSFSHKHYVSIEVIGNIYEHKNLLDK